MVQCWGGSRFGEDKMGFGLVVHAMVVGVVLTSGLGVDARALRLMPGRDASVRGVQNGVLTYPIHSGMGYNGPWRMLRQRYGPNVFAKDGYFRFVAEGMDGAAEDWREGHWMFVDLHPSLDHDGSAALFRMRLNSMEGKEVQMIVLANIVLRIREGGEKIEWARWTGTEFESLAESGLRADGKWHQVLILTSANGFTLIENGQMLFQMDKPLIGEIPQTFHMSKMSPDSSISLDLGDVVSIPGPGAKSV